MHLTRCDFYVSLFSFANVSVSSTAIDLSRYTNTITHTLSQTLSHNSLYFLSIFFVFCLVVVVVLFHIGIFLLFFSLLARWLTSLCVEYFRAVYVYIFRICGWLAGWCVLFLIISFFLLSNSLKAWPSNIHYFTTRC